MLIKFIDFEEVKAWVSRMIDKDFQQEILSKINDHYDSHGEFAFS